MNNIIKYSYVLFGQNSTCLWNEKTLKFFQFCECNFKSNLFIVIRDDLTLRYDDAVLPVGPVGL